MLKGISWNDYLNYSGGILAMYYLLVTMWLGLRQRKKGGGKPGSPPNYFKAGSAGMDNGKVGVGSGKGSSDNHPAAAMPAIHDLVDELQAYISAVGKAADKTGLMASLSDIIQKYPVSVDANYRPGLQSLIAVTVENKCELHLSAEEVAALW